MMEIWEKTKIKQQTPLLKFSKSKHQRQQKIRKKIIVANPPNPVDLIKTNLSKDESKAKKSEEKIVSLDVSKASQAKDDGKNELKIVDIPNKKDDGKISKKEEKNVIVEVSKAKNNRKIKECQNKIEDKIHQKMMEK